MSRNVMQQISLALFISFFPAISFADGALNFNKLISKYDSLTELQRKPFFSTIEGKSVSGQGVVDEVGECSSSEKRYLDECVSVSIQINNDFIVAYYPSSDINMLIALNKGDKLSVKDCRIVKFTDWGFWKTIYCVVGA